MTDLIKLWTKYYDSMALSFVAPIKLNHKCGQKWFNGIATSYLLLRGGDYLTASNQPLYNGIGAPGSRGLRIKKNNGKLLVGLSPQAPSTREGLLIPDVSQPADNLGSLGYVQIIGSE